MPAEEVQLPWCEDVGLGRLYLDFKRKRRRSRGMHNGPWQLRLTSQDVEVGLHMPRKSLATGRARARVLSLFSVVGLLRDTTELS